MRALLLIRHGALVGDADRRFLGATNSPMSEAGKSAVRALAERLRASYALQAVYCSDLGRSRRSAECLAGGEAPVYVRPALREINMGEWEERLRSQIAEWHPRAYAERGADLVHNRPPGGESFADLAARVLPCWREIVAAHADGVVAIAGHAGVNRVILCETLGMPLENLFRLAQRPACLNIIEWRRGAPVARLIGAAIPDWPSISMKLDKSCGRVRRC